MPEHYFRCENCGYEITSEDDGQEKRCSKMIGDEFCKGHMHKVYKPFSFVLKGGGFYGRGKV